MNVRAYQPKDTAALARLFTDAVHVIHSNDYSREQIAAWAPDPPNLERWRRRFRRRAVLIAERGSEIIGFATFEPDGHLDHMYVRRRFQRQGVASALYRRIEQEATLRGIFRIFTEASITARSFFEHVGFRVVATQSVKRRGVLLTNFRTEKHLP